jgi:hypothetical protein
MMCGELIICQVKTKSRAVTGWPSLKRASRSSLKYSVRWSSITAQCVAISGMKRSVTGWRCTSPKFIVNSRFQPAKASFEFGPIRRKVSG